MIVVNQDRTFILETKDLWRDKNSIYCNNYTANEFNIKLATYDEEDDAFYVFENMLQYFTDTEPYYFIDAKSVRCTTTNGESRNIFELIESVKEKKK